MRSFDVIIVGGGVVGCMTARTLSRYDLKILLIDKESDIGTGASAANSAIIHAGHDPIPGSLKAEMNRLGNPMWDQISKDLNIPFIRKGAYIVAVNDEEYDCLEGLYQRGMENQVTCEIISGKEMQTREPQINPEVRGALFTPTAGMVDPFAACLAPIENAIENGVTVMLETEFLDFIKADNCITGIKTNQGDFSCRWVVNAAGIYSDRVMHLAGEHPEFSITSRKGEYYILDKSEIKLDTILFPVPSKVSKGILVFGTTHGNVLVGPNSADEPDREDVSVTSDGLNEVWQNALKLVPSLHPRSIIGVFAGLRNSGNGVCKNPNVNYHHDFIIEQAENVVGLINLAGIESPGFTSAPAIAQRVVELLQYAGEELEEKDKWNPIRSHQPRFNHLSREQQADIVARDPSYGRIVCRCEMVTEGDILAAIHSPLPAKTYDAVKRRTWLGTGRCLGSFDTPRVVEILARDWNISIEQVTKKGPGSEFLMRQTKRQEG